MSSEQPQERSTARTGGPALRPGIARGSRLGRLLLLPVLAGMALTGPGIAQATSTWQTNTSSLATARYSFGTTTAPCPSPSTGTCLYAIGGYNSGGKLSSVEYYDPSTSTSGSWQSAPSLVTARAFLAATTAPCPSPSTGTCLFALGGQDRAYNTLSSVEYYDPSTGTSGSWHSAPSLVTPRTYPGVTTAPCPSPSTGTCLYAIGGDYAGVLSSVEYYDPSTGTSGSWHSAPSLVTPRYGLGTTTAPCPAPSTGTCLYAIGGRDGTSTIVASVEYYDPSTGTSGSWHSAPSLVTSRGLLGATTAPCPSPSIGTCLYAIGGYHNSYAIQSSVEYYAPSTGTSGSWQSAPSLATGRYDLGTTTAPCPSPSTGTCLYAIGGLDINSTILSSVEHYAPSASPTLAVLSHTHLVRSHSRLVVSWNLADHSGVLGFRVYAGRQQLTAHLIPIHASSRYRAVFQTHATGSVHVHLLRTDGSWVSIAMN